MTRKLLVKASSLIETVIAITIITLCSLIGTLVYSKVIDQTPPIRKYKYTFELEKIIEETFINNNLKPLKKKFDGFSIEKKVVQNPAHKNIKNITFFVISQEDSLSYPIALFYKNEEED